MIHTSCRSESSYILLGRLDNQLENHNVATLLLVNIDESYDYLQELADYTLARRFFVDECYLPRCVLVGNELG